MSSQARKHYNKQKPQNLRKTIPPALTQHAVPYIATPPLPHLLTCLTCFKKAKLSAIRPSHTFQKLPLSAKNRQKPTAKTCVNLAIPKNAAHAYHLKHTLIASKSCLRIPCTCLNTLYFPNTCLFQLHCKTLRA